MRIDDVHKVTDAPWRMADSVEMDMDTAGFIRKSSVFSQHPCECLYLVYIFPIQQSPVIVAVPPR